MLVAAVGGQPVRHHFSCEYIYSNTKGEITGRKLIEGDVVDTVRSEEWNNVSAADGTPAGVFGPPVNQPYMQGFSFDPTAKGAEFRPELFKAFPPNAIEERNLVWDTKMFRAFAPLIDRVKPGQVTPFKSAVVDLAGAGKFANADIELTALGSASIRGHRCQIMKYTAFFNKLQVTAPGLNLVGRSHYWGEVWVDRSTHNILLGTLYEDVLGEMSLASGPMRIINVFRKGVLSGL